MNQEVAAVQEHETWGPLYRVGAGAAVAMLALVPIAVLGFVVAPPPSNAIQAFVLFQKSGLLGLLSLDLIYMVEIVLGGLLLLAISVALRRVSPSFITVSLFLNVLATAIYFASNPAFEMLTLSRQYAAATNAAQKSLFVSAGEAMLATYEGTAYNVSYVIAGAAALTIALVMLRSHLFGKATAYLGIVMGVLALIPPTVGTVGLIAAFLYLVPLLVWLVLIARGLLKLGRMPKDGAPSALSGRARPQQLAPQPGA